MDVPHRGVVEGFEERFNHSVKLVCSDFFVCSVVLQLYSRLLPSGAGFQWCFLEQ